MAHKKGAGSSNNGRDSEGRRLGFKKYARQLVKKGNIILRQVGSVFHAGANVGMGRDFTLYALSEGAVKFIYKGKKKFVSVAPAETLEK